MLAAYLERHRRGELTERHVEHLVAELRRLREELKATRHELLQARRRYAALNGRTSVQRKSLP